MKKQSKNEKRSKHKNEDNQRTSNPSTTANSNENSFTEHQSNSLDSVELPTSSGNDAAHQQLEQIFWTKSTNDEEKTREEEFDEYLADLLL